MKLCGKVVKCWDFHPRPCLREQNHKGGCNPFSNSLLATGMPIEVVLDQLCELALSEA